MVQSVEPPALAFSSGHDLMVRGFEPHVWLCADGTEGTEPAWNSLSLSLPLIVCALSLKNKLFKKIFFKVYLFLRERDRA